MSKSGNKLKIFIGILAVLAIIRIALPSLTKFALNEYLEDFSPSLTAHVSDVDMAIIRGSYTLKGIEAHIKKNNREILKIGSVNASLSWKELFEGFLSSNILIKNLELNFTENLLPAVKEHLASLKEPKKKEEPRILIPRLDLLDSRISTDYVPSLTTQERIILSDLSARIANVVPHENSQLSPFNVKGTLIGSGKMKMEGEMNLYADKPKWTLDTEILNFDLTTLNKFLKEKLPLTFTKGELDFYAEAKSETGTIKGYFKPFIKGLDVVKSDEDFEGPRHWIIEIISAIGNITFKADEVMATRIPFTIDKEFKVDGDETIAELIAHGFLQEQSRGIENSIGLKQAQEEK